MKLERVDITGFKSFGEKVELTFHEGVTAIVGPNGCGKSNIADAIGWVLGEQSAKHLRGQKMEDVIFNGSQSRPPLSLAQVNLRVSRVNIPIQTKDGKRVSSKGEVLVSRRLDRSGHSDYLLDGVTSRLKDVHELFMGTGVGAKAYAIIEQGKIGLILSSKPTDRRSLIEEAAGITKYKSRRRSAELKLTAAQQNLLRVNDIVYEITRQMNSLKRQAGKARRYRRLRDALEHLERIVSVSKADSLGLKLKEIRGRLQSVADEELRRSTSLQTAEGYLERARLAQAEHEVALGDARDSLHRLELTIERLEQTRERGKQQGLELDARKRQLETELSELETRRGPVQERLVAREEEEGKLASELAGLEEQAARQQGRLKQEALSLAEMESSIEERRGEIVHRISKIAALHNFLQGVLANADKVSGELLKLDEESRDVETERRRLEETRAGLRKELEGQRQKTEALSSERNELERVAERLRSELSALDEALGRDKEELSNATARLASLEELVSARAHFASGARLLLTKGAEAGLGTSGSLADAVEVDERLEKAAEAYFGPALQRIRVAGEDDIGRARALLDGDEEDAGRAELLVESFPAPGRNGLSATVERLRAQSAEGVVGLLSEGVRFEGADLSPFLPDAIVVETFDQALRCYRQEAAPYVTVDGEVLEPPGVVGIGSGGAGAGLLKTRREIRELETTVASKRERLADAGERRERLSGDLDRRAERLESLRDQQHALEKVVVGLEHRLEQLREEAERLERKREVLESERSRSESEKASLAAKQTEMEQTLETEEASKRAAEEALETLRAQLRDRRAGVEALQAKASDEQSALAALRERRDAVKVDVERLREGVRELSSRVDANRREQERIEDRKKALREEGARAEVDLRDAIASRGRTEKEARALEARVASLRSCVDTTEVALKARRRELDEVRERRSTEEVVLAREESELEHLRESFESSHGRSLEEARSLLSPLDLMRGGEETQSELESLKDKIDAIGPVNPMADEEYRELETRHEFVTRQRQDLLDSIASTETAINRIDRTSKQRFKEAFTAINEEFDVTFKQLFGGGQAGLRLVDEDDLLETGIDIIAQPPGKKLQNVLLLSGGEKALTAIALLFAIFRYRPSPFCLLDEVDAPLDDANVGRFVSMLRELRDTTQFIVITHNRKTMEMADHLYGVTMEEPGVSKLVSVNFVEGEPTPEEALA